MAKRGNPIGAQKLLLQTSEDLEKQTRELIAKIREVDTDLLGWLRKQKNLTQLRLGVRDRRRGPWKGSSNISVPLIDGVIRRWKPGIASLVLDADPIAYMRPQGPEDIDSARQAEQFMTYLMRERIKATYPVLQLVDTIAWRGHAYTRENWLYQTEREARIINVAEIFGDIQEFVLQTQKAIAEQGGDDIPDAEDIVIEKLSAEYDLDQDNPVEDAVLQDAANLILNGEDYVKIVYRTITEDRPSWQVIDPINVITPQDQDPENGEFFCIIHSMSEDEIRALGVDGYLDRGAVEDMLAKLKGKQTANDNSISDSQRETIRDVRNRQAGTTPNSQSKNSGVSEYTIWEIYAKLDADGDGERERVVLWYSPATENVLGILDFVFPFRMWPVTYYPFEAAARPIDNRGIGDMLRSFQRLVNSYHNARIDASQLLLAPVFQRRATAGNYSKSFKFRPGAVMPVQNVGDFSQIQTDLRPLSGLIAEEQSNRRDAETYVGVFDSSLTNISNSSERRTATEVNAVQGLSSSIFGLDAKIFQVAFSRSLTKLWKLQMDFGEAELTFRVLGEELPVQVARFEIDKDYDIVASGTPSNTNRVLQLNTLQQAMQVVMSNPLILQSGRIDFAKLTERWLQLLDNNIAKEVIRPAEEAAAVQQLMQAAESVTGEQAPPL